LSAKQVLEATDLEFSLTRKWLIAALFSAEGSLMVNGTHVGKGSGAAMWGDDPFTITALSDAEIVMVETI